MKAVFFDRDGVLNQEVGYIHQVTNLNLMPGAAQAVRLLNDAGWFTALVSNQSGPARGFYGVAHIELLHQRLQLLLQQEAGAHLDSLSYCPYLSLSTGGTVVAQTLWSTWRKPNTGMFTATCWRYGLNPTTSFMIGDKATDVDMAHNSGLQAVLVTSGYGAQVAAGNYQHRVEPEHICADVLAAVQWILRT